MSLTWNQLKCKNMHPYLITRANDPMIMIYKLSKDKDFIFSENSDKVFISLVDWSDNNLSKLRGWLEDSILALVCDYGIVSYQNRGRYGGYIPEHILKTPCDGLNKGDGYFVIYGSNNRCMIITDHTTNADDILESYRKALNSGHL
jgi:hypothetical protein